MLKSTNRQARSLMATMGGQIEGMTLGGPGGLASRVIIVEVADQLAVSTDHNTWQTEDLMVFEDLGPRVESIAAHLQIYEASSLIRFQIVIETSYDLEKWWSPTATLISDSFNAAAPAPGQNQIETAYTPAATELSRHIRLRLLYKTSTDTSMANLRLSVMLAIKTFGT